LAEKVNARIIRNTQSFNYSHTLNLGFAAARNEWLLSLSAHCLPVHSDLLERYREALSQLPENIGAIYGLQAFSLKGYNRLAKKIIVRSGIVPAEQWRGGGNTNALYARAVWRQHPFDETMSRAEDREWCNWALGAGYSCAEVAEACVLYRHNKGPIYRFKKAYEDVVTCTPDAPPTSVRHFMMGLASATRHLLWEGFHPRSWIGEMARSLGAFVASRRRKRS
jgi:hypothetical protein